MVTAALEKIECLLIGCVLKWGNIFSGDPLCFSIKYSMVFSVTVILVSFFTVTTFLSFVSHIV